MKKNELAAWYALHELTAELGINGKYTYYAMSCQTNFY